MHKKTLLFTLAAATCAVLAAVPASAGSFSIYGAYWDTDAADNVLGGGVRLGVPLGEMASLDFSGTYYEEGVNEPFEAIGDLDTPLVENGLQILPLDIGLSWRLGDPDMTVRPYIGGGGTYYKLDSDFGDVSDEGGWFARGGVEIGSFFAEAMYRGVETTVEFDPDEFDDVDDIDFNEEVEVDLSGFALNAGFVWRW